MSCAVFVCSRSADVLCVLMCCCAALHTHTHPRSVRAQGQTRLRQSIESRILVEALTGANAHPRAAAHESRAPACRGGAVPTVLTRRLTRRTALPRVLWAHRKQKHCVSCSALGRSRMVFGCARAVVVVVRSRIVRLCSHIMFSLLCVFSYVVAWSDKCFVSSCIIIVSSHFISLCS